LHISSDTRLPHIQQVCMRSCWDAMSVSKTHHLLAQEKAPLCLGQLFLGFEDPIVNQPLDAAIRTLFSGRFELG
jgi:hypothetical protein